MGASRWCGHFDSVFVEVNGVQIYLWRAADHEGKAFEAFVRKSRDKKAALKFPKKLKKRHGRAEEIAIDGPKS